MSDVLHEYMSKRVYEINFNDFNVPPGPVITISRAAGCITHKMASNLANRLNTIQQTNKWNLISKEILYKTAEKLRIHPDRVKSISRVQDNSLLDGIMHSFLTRDYQLVKRVRNTLINVIHHFGIEGNAIIMGRGGSIICSEIENAMHIRIDAPLNWRIRETMRLKNFDKYEATSYIMDTENDRVSFRKSIKGRDLKCNEFDLTINQSEFSDHDIIEIILTALKMKKII